MNAPLFDCLINNSLSEKASFHMPGHSGGSDLLDPRLYSVAPIDVTELSFSDNMLDEKGVILEAERLCAKAYHVKHSLFFTNGCTSAIFTAIAVLKKHVQKVCVIGNPHKSVINALELFGLSYTIDKKGIPSDAFIVTTPDYFGKVTDYSYLKKEYPSSIILVDEAHGAHFTFSPLLPKSATNYADLVVNSMHKTLPVFTGGALLHTTDTFFDDAWELRGRIHSTSPSYLIMASMDYARAYLEEKGASLYSELKEEIDSLALPKGFSIDKNDDFTRLVINVPNHTNGYAVSRGLEKQGIFVEMATFDKLVLIVTPFNKDKLKLLKNLDELPLFCDNKIGLSYLIGKIATRDIGLYPPSTLLVKKGEVISADTVKIMEREYPRVFGID